MSDRRRVAVVTGGGGGIGAAIAEELGRHGWFVATADPLVTLDGTERLPEPQETTAGRIVAAGGAARASSASVTDAPALHRLFEDLVQEHGALDAVVNVAGITRKSGFAEGTEEDWLALLTVHLGGYLNVLGAALPLMAAAGHGRILGVTSGSGWRAADAGGYSCAKRVVASLTWQLGALAPAGVTVNAISPIAATRMVAAAAERARQEGRSGAGGGLSLFRSMPGPEALGPLGAHLVSDELGWCRGQVLFAGGSETAVVAPPRLLEVLRTADVASLPHVLTTVIPRAFATAEANQASGGGGNPRFAALFEEAASVEPARGDVRSCAIVTDRPPLASAIEGALQARSVACRRLEPTEGFADAAKSLRGAVEVAGPVDAIVVVRSGGNPADGRGTGWERVLAEHDGIVAQIQADAGWARAAADYAVETNRPIRLVTLVDATTAGGRSRAQAAAQLARVSLGTTDGRVSAFTAGIEALQDPAAPLVGELVAFLLCDPGAGALVGAELVVGGGWLGLRSHPHPAGTLSYGGAGLPEWFDTVLGELVGSADHPGRRQTR
ncbi:MAG TPA: SDR family NAD(P)-dependent oxidoreductase [Acidimicrobiales bacterium]|nr:SDR family NAD(P)-dependent oxidoreductase [Acidimicrobiales bacterium]